MTASVGPRGGRAALYRREAGSDAFVKAHASLPEWFAGNIDTHSLAAAGGTVVFGVEDGRAFLSEDGGNSWSQVLGGSSPVTCVGVGAA